MQWQHPCQIAQSRVLMRLTTLSGFFSLIALRRIGAFFCGFS